MAPPSDGPRDHVLAVEPEARHAPDARTGSARASAPGGGARGSVPPAPTGTGAIAFRFLASIAIGATTHVDLCRAEGARDGQLLAVKRLLPHAADEPSFANQFLDEVWMTAALKHPNVVEVAGWGVDAEGAYLAFELVQGVSLARLMKTVFETGEVFTERMVVYIASQLCRGLAAAHALRSPQGELLNLVHRDLTPANVLIGFNGDVKIADFGLAKAKQRVTKTMTGLLKGQPAYMAPEQARGHDIDRRADLFSLGVVLFELFAGRRPWSAQGEFETVHVTASTPPADLKELRPKIDRELVSIVMGCLEKDPARRFQSAEEIGRRLDTWLETHGYLEGNAEALARFVRRNAMRQIRWFERAIAGELAPMPDSPRPSGVPQDPAPSSDARRARVRPRRPMRDAEVTDVTQQVTNPELKIAALHASTADASPKASPDEGDEIPTQENRRLPRPEGASRARVKPRPPVITPVPVIYDEDSDGRTTDVRQRTGRMPLLVDGVGSRPPPRASSIPVLYDNEGEEAPTVPIKAADARRLRTAVLDQHRFEPAAAARSTHPASAAVPPLPPALPVPRVPTPAPHGSVVSHPASTPPRPLTEELLLAEADRLALEAVRANEAANAAASVANRKATIAKIAGDAAMLAAEAVRIAATHGIAAAGRRLDDARAIEAAVAQAGPTGNLDGIAALARERTAGLAPQASGGTMVGPVPGLAGSSTAGFDPNAIRIDVTVSGGSTGIDATAFHSFRERVRPTVLGMPLTIVLALTGLALAGIVAAVWLLFPQ